MGYDAFVRCRCFEDGLLSDPPVPHEDIYVHEESFLWAHSLDDDGNENLRGAFHEWAACEHGGKICSERVANAGGMGQLRAYIEKLGRDRLPTLSSMLPHGNEGQFPAEKAAAALAELDEFERLGKTLHEYRLFNLGKNDWSARSTKQGWLVLPSSSQGEEVRAEFVVSSKGLKFQAKRFRQIALCRKGWTGACAAQLVELNPVTGSDVSEPFTVPWPINPSHIEDCEFEVREDGFPQDFTEWKAEILRRLLRASLETGNPIVWC